MVDSQAVARFTPIYVRIQDQVRARILSGELAVGDRVPSDSELADLFRTTRATVRQALARLVHEGLIVRQVGRGSFVAPRLSLTPPIDTETVKSFEEQIALSGRRVSYRMVSDERVKASEEIALRLQRPPGELLRRITRLRCLDGQPICVDIRFVPDPLATAITPQMLQELSMHDIMGAVIGGRVPAILVSVTAENADATISGLLGLRRGGALLVREHVYFNYRSEPILYGRPLYRGDIGLSFRMAQP